MAMHPNFPLSPFEILKPEVRWFPADETLRDTSYEKLMPPLVSELRKQVFEWRNNGYPEISNTGRTLLNWWFNTQHPGDINMYPTIHIPMFACAVDLGTLISDSNGTFQIEHPTIADRQIDPNVKFVYSVKRKDEINNYHMPEVRNYFELYNEARLEIYKQAKVDLEEQLHNINNIIKNLELCVPEEKAKLERKKKRDAKKQAA